MSDGGINVAGNTPGGDNDLVIWLSPYVILNKARLVKTQNIVVLTNLLTCFKYYGIKTTKYCFHFTKYG